MGHTKVFVTGGHQNDWTLIPKKTRLSWFFCLFPSWRSATGMNWPVTSCTRRCIPSSMYTSRPSPSPEALKGRGVAAASPDHPQRERRKIKQTSARDHHLHPPITFHSGTFLRWGKSYLTRLFKRIRWQLQNSHKVPPETQLCTPRTLSNDTLQNFHL